MKAYLVASLVAIVLSASAVAPSGAVEPSGAPAQPSQEPSGTSQQGPGGTSPQGYGGMSPQGYGGMPPQEYGGMPPQGYGGMPPWGPGGTQWMERSASANGALLDARLAGMKAGLKLTPDQEKLWGPFEAAVRDAGKARIEAMQNMRRMMQLRESASLSPVDRLEAKAERMAKRASELKAIADATKPLFDSLDPTQKDDFEMLARAMFAPGPGPGGMARGPWRGDRGAEFDGPEDSQ